MGTVRYLFSYRAGLSPFAPRVPLFAREPRYFEVQVLSRFDEPFAGAIGEEGRKGFIINRQEKPPTRQHEVRVPTKHEGQSNEREARPVIGRLKKQEFGIAIADGNPTRAKDLVHENPMRWRREERSGDPE